MVLCPFYHIKQSTIVEIVWCGGRAHLPPFLTLSQLISAFLSLASSFFSKSSSLTSSLSFSSSRTEAHLWKHWLLWLRLLPRRSQHGWAWIFHPGSERRKTGWGWRGQAKEKKIRGGSVRSDGTKQVSVASTNRDKEEQMQIQKKDGNGMNTESWRRRVNHRVNLCGIPTRLQAAICFMCSFC